MMSWAIQTHMADRLFETPALKIVYDFNTIN